jgi:hypothetical protein
MTKAKHGPHGLTLLMADDTVKVALPHCTNRSVKGLSSAYTVDFIPWLVRSFSNNKECYVYTLKGTQSKVCLTSRPPAHFVSSLPFPVKHRFFVFC